MNQQGGERVYVDEVVVSESGKTLQEYWLLDQSLVFAATLLGNVDEHFPQRPRACIKLLLDEESRRAIEVGRVSDSTLLLINAIDKRYFDKEYAAYRKRVLPDDIVGHAEQLAQLVEMVRGKLEDRGLIQSPGPNGRTPRPADLFGRLLISHASHLLKQPHITIITFIKWLRHATQGDAKGTHAVIKRLKESAVLSMEAQQILDAIRNPCVPIYERIKQIDTLYRLVLQVSSSVAPWWTRICMAYRSSLFCWPLLTDPHSRVSLSLPFLLSLNEDGQSRLPPSDTCGLENNGQKVGFTCGLLPYGKVQDKHRDFPGCDTTQVHVLGRHIGFNQAWENAFRIGMYAAKILWSNQKGCFRPDNGHGDDERKYAASLHVDMHAVHDIVNSVYSKIPECAWWEVDEQYRVFMLNDRSAEAYWVQCVLGLLLPAREVPLGLCTGTIEYKDGEFLIGPVAGIREKLDYADRSGVPRVVIPGAREDYRDASMTDAEGQAFKNEVNEFLHTYGSERFPRTLEFNFSRTARAAANAMQPSGWNRANFLRTPDFRRGFIAAQDHVSLSGALPDIDGYLKRIDDVMLTQHNASRAIQHIERNGLLLSSSRGLGSTVEEALGKWAVWKDHQVRSQHLWPEFSVLALRTAEGDSDIRLWAALAEILGASDDWWNKFHCAELPEAANLIAQILCNKRADPTISSGSPPDLLIIFDDAGLTQERGKATPLKQFRHQFDALLNPRHAENQECHYLDEALEEYGKNMFSQQIRIVVVSKIEMPLQEGDIDDESLSKEDVEFLKKMAVFRFGCSRQESFAMVNFDRESDNRIDWHTFESLIVDLLARKLITGKQNVLQVTSKARWLLQKTGQVMGSPEGNKDEMWWHARAHHYAALVLCPILHPPGFRITTGRDRQLEPGNVLEADWHLRCAYSLIPKRFHAEWKKYGLPRPQDSQVLLASLRARPDWDTVYRMRVNKMTCRDSVELCHELIQTRREQTGLEPSLSMVGWTIESMAFAFDDGDHRQKEIDRGIPITAQAEELVKMAEDAIARMSDGLDDKAREYQTLFLYSRLLVALRKTGMAFTDPKLKELKCCIDAAVEKMVEKNFLLEGDQGQENFDAAPISKACWRVLWDDGKDSQYNKTSNKTLGLKERSRYAYAATRMNLKKDRFAPQSSDTSWEEPWLIFFARSHPKIIDTAQIVGPLCNWWALYGDEKDSSEFGRRILDMRSHMEYSTRNNPDFGETWPSNIVQACENLWKYLNLPVSKYPRKDRLNGLPIMYALRLINVLALQETLPAFNFISSCSHDWIEFWVDIINRPKSSWPAVANETFGAISREWRKLAESVVRHRAGWVLMFARIKSLPDDNARLGCVRNWLLALSKVLRRNNNFDLDDSLLLSYDDPENILYHNGVESVKNYKLSLKSAVGEAYRIFLLENDAGWAVYGHHRILLTKILAELTSGLSQTTTFTRIQSADTISL